MTYNISLQNLFVVLWQQITGSGDTDANDLSDVLQPNFSASKFVVNKQSSSCGGFWMAIGM